MAEDDGTYYDRLIQEIDAMTNVLEDDSVVQLCKEQCKEMVRNFKYVGNVLGKMKDMRADDRFSSISKELYRQTFEASAVLKSCCCNVEVKQDDRTVTYSWLQAAVTQSEEMIFKVIWDDLSWCLGLVLKVGEPRGYRFSAKLAEMDRSLIDADKVNLKEKLDEVLAQGPPASAAQKRDRLLARFLQARLNKEEEHVFFANSCEFESDIAWSRKQTVNILGPCVTAVDWLGVRLARKVFFNQQRNGEFLVEREIMADLNHPNVVRFISYSDREGDPAILMECVKTTLEKHLKQRVKKYAATPLGMVGGASFNVVINILEIVDIMYKIAFVMAFIHGKGVAHCDIKPSNLLVIPFKVSGFEGYVQLKIADFGVSKAGLNEGPLRDSSKKSRGTTIYRAPELFGHPKNVDLKKADVFSFPLTCWHILHGTPPFANVKKSTLTQDLLRGTRPDIDSEVPLILADLVRSCWKTDPQDRPTFSDVCIELQRFKEFWLGFGPLESISAHQDKSKTDRRQTVSQNVFRRLKTLAIQSLPSQSSGTAERGEDFVFPGDIISACKSARGEEQTIAEDITNNSRRYCTSSNEVQTTPADIFSDCKSASVGENHLIRGRSYSLSGNYVFVYVFHGLCRQRTFLHIQVLLTLTSLPTPLLLTTMKKCQRMLKFLCDAPR